MATVTQSLFTSVLCRKATQNRQQVQTLDGLHWDSHLSSKHRNVRLQWAQVHTDRAAKDTSSFWFMPRHADGRIRIWQQQCGLMSIISYASSTQIYSAERSHGFRHFSQIPRLIFGWISIQVSDGSVTVLGKYFWLKLGLLLLISIDWLSQPEYFCCNYSL